MENKAQYYERIKLSYGESLKLLEKLKQNTSLRYLSQLDVNDPAKNEEDSR
jgi:hypothetical protein